MQPSSVTIRVYVQIIKSTKFCSSLSKRRQANSCLRGKWTVNNSFVCLTHFFQSDACVCAEHVETLQAELSSHMKLLRETVQSKMAVPTAKVFVSGFLPSVTLLFLLLLDFSPRSLIWVPPHIVFQPLFKSISKLWSGLQDEGELLNILSNIALNLQPFVASQAKIFSEAPLDVLLEASEVKTDEQRMAESSGMEAVTRCAARFILSVPGTGARHCFTKGLRVVRSGFTSDISSGGNYLKDLQ